MKDTEKDGYVLYGIDFTPTDYMLTDFEEICNMLGEEEEELIIKIFS